MTGEHNQEVNGQLGYLGLGLLPALYWHLG